MDHTEEHHAPARIDAFVDAAFAFAMTLLVISVGDPPADLDALRGALLRIPAFAAGFALIALFWWAHHSYARVRPNREGLSLVFSLAVVFLVLVYVYPLRLLTLTSLGFITGGLLPGGELLNGFDDLQLLYVVYGVGFAALSGLFALMYAHARREAGREGAEARRALAGAGIGPWLVLAVAGVISTVLALTLPIGASALTASAPGLAYCGIPIAMAALGRRAKRRAGLREAPVGPA